MFKKLIRPASLILTVCLLISCMSLSAYAGDLQPGKQFYVGHIPSETLQSADKKQFFKVIQAIVPKPMVTVSDDGTITVNKPNTEPIAQTLENGSEVFWVCTGVMDPKTQELHKFNENNSVTFAPTAATANYYWEIPKIQKFSVEYDLNTESLDGYDVYPVVAYQFTPSPDEMIGGIVSGFSNIPVCFFTDDNKWTGSLNGEDVAQGSVFQVGMGFGPGAAEPVVDFLARKDNGNGTYSYKSLNNWVVNNTDETVEQGTSYKPTENVTLTANWVDVTDFGVASDGPKLPLTSSSWKGYDATIFQDTSSRQGTVADIQLNPNETTIYYTAEVKMNPLLASSYLLGDRTAEEGFAEFTIKVELDKSLELVADESGKVSIEFKCPFLVPGEKIQVNNHEVDISSTSSNGIHTITADKSAVDAAVAADQTTVLELPVKWDVNADTSNLKEPMSMIAATQIKEGATAAAFTTTGSVSGSIDLSKANVNAHQVIRFILGDPEWKSHYKGDKDELDITDTLKAVEHLEYKLKNVELTANKVTAKAAYVPATGITLNETALNLVSNDDAQKTATLKATVEPESASQNVFWSTSNAAVATVENGVVTAVGAGEATITASVEVNGKTYEATCVVTVTAAPVTNYTVTFNWADGHTRSETVPAGSTITAPTVPSYTSGNYRYTFSSWSPAFSAKVTADATYTAQYTRSYIGTTGGTTGGGSTSRPSTGGGGGGGGRPGSDSVRPGVTIGENQTPLAETPFQFIDVAEGSYCHDAVYWAVNQGITNGVTENTFAPNGACTRAQIVTFLWRAAGSPEAEGENPFTDVAANAYYYNAVLWAVAQGITGGTTATTFSPNATCNRGQAVTFLYRAAGSPETSGTSSFTDLADGAYYLNAVLWAVEKGVTGGTSATTFAPNATCTRGQIVTFLHRDRA